MNFTKQYHMRHAIATHAYKMVLSVFVASILCISTSTVYANNAPTLDELLELVPNTSTDIQDTPKEPSETSSDHDADAIELDAEVLRKIDPEQATQALEQALAQMRDVSQRIEQQKDTGLEVQRQQQRIIDQLDQAIAEAQRRESASAGSGGDGDNNGQSGESGSNAGSGSSGGSVGQRPANPADAAGQSQGSAGPDDTQKTTPHPARESRTDARPLEELRQEWGNLPPRLRDELLEGLSENFSPVYRQLTESYYRRLAESAQEWENE